MPTFKKKQVWAMEDRHRNYFDGSNLDKLEPLAGDGMAPFPVKLEDDVDLSALDPDPHHASYVLIPASRRLSRIACQLVKNGFKGV